MSDIVSLPARFSAATKAKGQDYVLAGAVKRTAETVWRVQGSRPQPYVVNADIEIDEDGGVSWEWAMCSCPHGRHHALVSCSHLFAAVLHTLLSDRGLLDAD